MVLRILPCSACLLGRSFFVSVDLGMNVITRFQHIFADDLMTFMTGIECAQITHKSRKHGLDFFGYLRL